MFMLMLEFSKRPQDSSVVSLIQPFEMLWPLQALQSKEKQIIVNIPRPHQTSGLLLTLESRVHPHPSM